MKRNLLLVLKDGRHVIGRGLLVAGASSTIRDPFDSYEGLDDTEDRLIQEIDERNMSPRKLLATRFLTFLGNRRLTLEKLKLLPKEERQRIRKEFLENN